MSPVVAGLLVLALPVVASAHRLDEYLQATRIDLQPRRIVLELELTPGAEVATAIARSIDADGDGTISTVEGRAYAQHVVDDLALAVDGDPRGLFLLELESSSLMAMRDGMGSLRLRIGATLGDGDAGRHQLTFTNRHRRDVGVYLVNALMPADRRVTITGQHRDDRQQGIRVDFDVSPAARWPSYWLLFGGLGAVGAAIAQLAHGECFLKRRTRTSRIPTC